MTVADDRISAPETRSGFEEAPGAARADRPLAPGRIRPRGWLERQLRLQADGITGRLEEVWPDVGPDSGWLGGPGEDWERGPYYLDGLVPLAHVLDDDPLRALAHPWIEWMLGSRREDGFFGPASNDDWWTRMVALKVLTQHADATGDDRVQPLVEAYLRFALRGLPERPLSGWGRVRGADFALTAWWLHDRMLAGGGDVGWILELIDLIAAQTQDWERYLRHDLVSGKQLFFDHRTHGVNVAMGLKTGAVAYLRDGDERHRDELEHSMSELHRWHGLVHGWFSGDEFLGGPEATAGVETCLVVEAMFTQQIVARALRDGVHGDRLETLAFNLLPASSDARMRAHQYHQQANQLSCTVAHRPWSYSGDDANVFGLEPHFGCCTANLHQGWPKFTASLWSATADGGLRAIAYAPSAVDAELPSGRLSFEVETEYPFDETVTVRVTSAAPVRAPLALRIPGWCDGAVLTVDGDPVEVAPEDGYVIVDREWSAGDELVLVLPMPARIVRRPRQAVGVRVGPLSMVLPIAEEWRELPAARGLGEWEVVPRGTWDRGVVDPAATRDTWTIERRSPGAVPWEAATAPVRLRVPTGRVRDWTVDGAQAGPVPAGPVVIPAVLDHHDLVPYGSARLRLAELPVVLPHPGPAGAEA